MSRARGRFYSIQGHAKTFRDQRMEEPQNSVMETATEPVVKSSGGAPQPSAETTPLDISIFLDWEFYTT